MSLVPQTVPILFTQGLDQKTDSKVVQIPSLLELENAVYQKNGRISKRNGYEKLGTQIEGSNNHIDSGQALGVFRGELNQYTGSKLYSYIPSTNRWREKGDTVSLITTTTPILRNPYQQSNINAAAIDSLTLYIWEDSRGGVRYSVLDGETILLQDVSIDVSGLRPRVIVFNNQFLLFYAVGTTLKYRLVAKGSPTVLSNATNFTTDLNAVQNYDCVTIGSYAFVAYYDNTNTISIRNMDQYLNGSAVTILAEDADNCISLCTDDSSRLWVTYSDDTNVRVAVYSFTLVLILASTTVETVADVINLTGSVIDSTLTLFYEVEAALSYNHFIRKNTVTVAGVVGSPADFKRSVGLASKAWINNETIYVNTIHESTFQSTYFTIAQTGNIIGKLNSNIGGVLNNNTCLTNVELSSAGFLFPNQIKTQLESQDSVLFTLKGVNATYLDFDSNNRFQNAELGELHIVGGIVQSYDGNSITEHGFSLFPEDVSSVSYNSGGNLTDGSYQYSVTYEWTDNLGQIHRSAPSVPTSVTISTLPTKTFANTDVVTATDRITVTGHGYATGEAFTLTTTGGLPAPLALATNYFAIVIDANTIKVATSLVNSLAGTAIDLTTQGTGTNTIHPLTGTSEVVLTIPTLRVTAKSGVTIVVYRTLNNGEVFYRCSSITSPTFNSISTDTVTFTDTTTDASIQTNNLLYTTGGILENIAPPSSSTIVVYQERIFLLTEDGSLWYSKKKQVGQPVEFTDSFVKSLSNTDGRVLGLGVIDSNFILFRATKIETFSGQGPNNVGVGDDYGDPQFVTSDTGCSNPNSIGTTPNGLIFDSPKGRYLLDRSLQASYIGAPVEDYNDLTVTSSALLSTKNEIRFLTLENITLTYNYYFSRWSVFTNVYGEDSAIYNDTYTFTQSDGSVWMESLAFQDGDQPIVMKITTSWLSFAQLQGFQRVWDCILLGEYKSPHKLQYSIGYDFNPSFSQVGTILPDVIFPNEAYAVSTPYGSDSVYGGEYPIYQFGNHLTRQKCTSLRISIQDNQNYLTTFGEGFSITSMTLVCGMKRGINKLQAKQTFSTEAA